MTLTSKQYVDKYGAQCPNCGSPDIEGIGEFDMDGSWITNKIQCNDCHATWDDVFTLQGYESLITSNKDI